MVSRCGPAAGAGGLPARAALAAPRAGAREGAAPGGGNPGGELSADAQPADGGRVLRVSGVRFHIIRNARIENVGKSQSCMVSK